MTRNHRQEAFSRAFFQAIAARCGLTCSFREFDYGIDMTLNEVVRRNGRYIESGFRLDVQARSFSSTMEGEAVAYDIDVKTYDALRDEEVGCPRILVLLTLPADEEKWSEQTEEHLMLRGGAYWQSLKGVASTTNRRSVRLAIPRGQLFSVEALRAMMQRVRRGEAI